MSSMSKIILFAAIVPLALTGCISTDPKTAFGDVQKNVAARTGQSVQWPEHSSTNDAPKVIATMLQSNLTAQAAVTIALLNNRSLQAEFAEIGISQAELAQASRMQNIELAGSWRIPDRPPSVVDAEYSATGNFLGLLTLPARKKIAAQNLEQTKLEVADKVLQLAADAQTAFYQLQAQAELVQRLASIVEANDAAANFAQRQFDAGNISDLELHSEQAPDVEAHLELMKAKMEAQVQREELNRLLGLSDKEIAWRIAEELPPLPTNEPLLQNLESLAVKQRFDLAAKRSQVNSLAGALRLKENTRFFPGVAIGVDTEKMSNGQRVTGPTLDLQVPLFDQGQPAVARLTALYQQAKDNYEAQEINARSEVREARDALLAAREMCDFAQKNLLPLRKQILSDTLQHYNAMQKNSYDLLLAKEREERAEEENIQALRNYWMTRVKLERAVGGRLTDENTASAESQH
jgi:outer membrane protein, heavy metal efflux system